MFDPQSPFPSHGHLTHRAMQPASKAALALARLREAIIGCELEPGAKINEQATAERFGLGRAAMRSALARLEGMHMVEAMPRSGWRVRPLRPQSIRDLIDARRRLEPMLIAHPLPAARLDALDRQAAMLAALLGQQSASARITGRSYDRQFLEILAEGANAWAIAWLRDSWDECARITTCFEASGLHRLALTDRSALVAALRKKDARAAQRALIAPIDEFAEFATTGLMSLEIEIAPPRAWRASRTPAPRQTVREEGTTDRKGQQGAET